MAQHQKKTTDHDDDGKMGGSRPAKSVESKVDAIIEVLKANGMSLPKELL